MLLLYKTIKGVNHLIMLNTALPFYPCWHLLHCSKSVGKHPNLCLHTVLRNVLQYVSQYNVVDRDWDVFQQYLSEYNVVDRDWDVF